jgi:hypothetical protein
MTTARPRPTVIPVIVGVLLTASIGIGMTAVSQSFDHEKRITVLEHAQFVTKSDLLESEARIVDCLNKIQRKQVCN